MTRALWLRAILFVTLFFIVVGSEEGENEPKGAEEDTADKLASLQLEPPK